MVLCLTKLVLTLAVKAFEHTAQYDGMIASYLGARVGKEEGQADKFARTFNTQLNKAQDLRYGENPASVSSILCRKHSN